MPFVKLDKGLLTSTLWAMRPEMEVFVTALLLAEPREFPEPIPTIEVGSLEDGGFTVPPGWYGFVPAAGPGIVGLAHVDEEEGMEALKRLSEPEPESRSKAHAGRRMVRVDGGYIVLNFMKYRDYDHSAADRMRRLRERRRGMDVTANSDAVTANEPNNGQEVKPVTRNVTHSRVQRAESRGQISESNPLPPAAPPEGKPKDPPPPAPTPKARNPLFDALALACDVDPLQMTATALRACGVALGEIRKACPDVTPADFTARATIYKRLMSGVILTPSALKNHWAECLPTNPQLNRQNYNGNRPNDKRVSQTDNYADVR